MSGPAWQVEEGIGEDRALLVDGEDVLAARVQWHDRLAPGTVADARLVQKTAGARTGMVRWPTGELAKGELVRVEGLPRDAEEGRDVRVELTRARISERGRTKFARCRPTTAEPAAPSLRSMLEGGAFPVRRVHGFAAGLWEDVEALAWSGEASFPGGAVLIAPTPAMTLIDIDGTLRGPELALAAIPAIARAVEWLDLGGSIGIDFPTIESREDRRAVDEALAAALDHWPHQRTAMNGFGFVQLVARLERPSLLHLAAMDPARAGALAVLRRAARVSPPGPVLLTVAPAVAAAIRPDELEALARAVGGAVQVVIDAALPPEAGHAQSLPAQG